jgi:hypothetical protein
MSELPLACTPSPDGMTARLPLIDALAADGLLDRTPTTSGMRGRLRERPTSSGARVTSWLPTSHAAPSWTSRWAARTATSCSTSPARRTRGR